MALEAVSVIIPCYRQAHFLAETLDSVLAQSHPAIQPIVVNDGSDDDTGPVANRYGDKIHYLEQSNQGLSAARNAGIHAAEGKYLLFLDADDLLHPDAVAWQLEAMAGREDRLGMMGHRLFQENPYKDGLREFIPDPDLTFYPIFIHECQGTPHCFFSSRRQVLAVGKFAPLLAMGCEDWDLWLRLVHDGAELVPVPHAGAYYRRYPGAMSTNRLRMLESRTQVLLRLHQRMVASPTLLSQWGVELLKAEHRVRRRCLAQGAKPQYVADLSQAMLELTGRGFRLKESLPKSLLVKALGEERAERFVFQTLALCFPGRFSRYKHGFT